MEERQNAENVTEREKQQWVEYELNGMKRKNKFNVVLWWTLVVMTALVLLSAAVSVVMYLVGNDLDDLETTLNQLFMSVLALLCFALPVVFRKRLKIYIPPYLLIVVYLFIFAHFILGEVYRAYDKSLVFDKILHTTGGVVIAFIGVSVVFALANMDSDKVRLSPFFIVLFSFCFALAIEYIWELGEYSVDRLIGANMQRWQDSIVGYDENGNAVHSVLWGSGLSDSMQDMAVNVLGAFAVCVFTFIVLVKKPQWLEGRLIASEKRLRAAAQLKVEEKLAAGEPVPDFAALMAENGRKRRKNGKNS